MLKLLEVLGTRETPRFAKVERIEYDLACPHCGALMREKDYSFGFDGDSGVWFHTCGDGGSKRMIRPTLEQEKQAASFDAWLNGGIRK